MPPRQFIIDRQQSRNIFSLNGTWDITGGDAAAVPRQWTSAISVPSVVDTAVPPYPWESFEYHWYRTSFTIEQITDADSIHLKIEQSMFGTEVWLNGRHLGGSISCYTSHEYLLDDCVNRHGPNELIVRVGAKSTLPTESAVGRDQEKEIYTPGILGDVSLHCTGIVRVKLVQVIPQIDTSTAEVRVWIQNLRMKQETVFVTAGIFKKKSFGIVSPVRDNSVLIKGHSTEQVIFHMPVDAMELWSPQHPFLYEAEITAQAGGTVADAMRTTFGMREFKITGSDFYLNGQKILLRGSNIAFHRFLSDKQRKQLPWDESWIKRALIDIPKDHHFNFFRNHLGQMYNKWYDIADEYGMLIQNEWQFWCVTGSDQQIRKEFTEWLQDNWNHPSIVIWDPLNESSDDSVQFEIVPEMKKLDPTRPWESVDFHEEHPYIYSLGMVMNSRTFGFARSLKEIEHLPVPSMVNEFLWWWFNDQWEPTVLTKMIVERWMGRDYSQEEVIVHQSFLAQELIELFRRMRIKAIQPFVYISNNDGPTAHWFLGDIRDLQPKPLMKAIKNAFTPFGVSIELWDRHFFVNERRIARIFIFNDTGIARYGILVFGIKLSDGQWHSKTERAIEVSPVSDITVSDEFVVPKILDGWSVCAELFENGSLSAASVKTGYAFTEAELPKTKRHVMVFDPYQEIAPFLTSRGIPVAQFASGKFDEAETIILNGNVYETGIYKEHRHKVAEFVKAGGTLVCLEPEYRVVGKASVTLVDGIDLNISRRDDHDKGGYDSYVFAEDLSHPVWKNIQKEHLKMFNGAYGGEIVSEYHVDFSVPCKRLASCGMGLSVTAAGEIEYGKGKILLVRIQLRGRLVQSPDPDSLFARRPDPVAQQLMMNIAAYS